MLVVNEKHLTLEYNEELKAIIQIWKGYFPSNSFRAGVLRTNKLFEKMRPVRKFLVDISTSSVISEEDTTWAARTAIPQAIDNGLKYYGFVLPENVFTQVSLKNFQEQLNQPSLEIALFKSLKEAKEWARQKSDPDL